MAKKTLDLSHTLTALHSELKETVAQLTKEPIKQDVLLDTIDRFANKYGRLQFTSIDELLLSNTTTSTYMAQSSDILFGDVLKELLPSS